MKRLFLLAALLIISIVNTTASGCASDVSEDLSGTSWRLVEYGEENNTAAVLDGTSITLSFADDLTRLTGNGGCNDYFADCAINGSNITVSTLGATQMNCNNPPGLMMQENTYFGLLGKVEKLEADGDSLTIKCANKQILVFEKTSAPGFADLAGSSWRLYYYKKGIRRIPPLPFTKITLSFDTNSAIARGNAGCNLYGADCLLQGDSISFSQLIQTSMKRDFPVGVMQQEHHYVELLEASESFSIDGDNLTIYCSGGEELHFRPD
jgi:heat shock protein HslJ